MRAFKFPIRRLVAVIAFVSSGVGLSGCTPDYADQQALSSLHFNGILGAGGGAFTTADGVTSQTFNLIGDDVTLGISNEAISPNANLSLYDVLLEGYTVSFERTDGGTAVPASFGSNFTQRIPISSFGATPSIISVSLQLLQPEQKLLAPLSDLTGFGFEQSTGFAFIHTRATIELFGRNLTGDQVSLRFPIRVTFCNSCLADDGN
jgi:hypothetical protein